MADQNDNPMPGLVSGSGMTPADLEEFLKRKQQMKPVAPEGMPDDQWQAAQQKLDEILAKQPKAQPVFKSPEEDYVNKMSPDQLNDLEKEFDNGQPVLDTAKKRALERLKYGQQR